jgi:hypothetical protein
MLPAHNIVVLHLETLEMGKCLSTLSLAKPRYNNKAALKTYELFSYEASFLCKSVLKCTPKPGCEFRFLNEFFYCCLYILLHMYRQTHK